VHKIQERGYVAKQDVTGRRVNCINYELDGGVLTQSAEERQFGNEKNRLVITPLGRAVIEFLCAHFTELFDYNYTKRMEQQLDQVSSGEKPWGDVCGECLSCVDRLLDNLNSKHLPNKSNKSNESNGSNELKTPKKETPRNLCKLLGKYNGDDLFLRTGKYGPYLTWGDQKKSLTHLKSKPQNDNATRDSVDDVPCSYDDAVRCIESSAIDTKTNATATTANLSILREINASTSVRTGQYGPYIYYKNPKMKTPAFVSLRGFKEDWKTCDLRILEMWSTTTPVKNKK
jgi:DNA topoisomerase-1